MSLCWRSTVMTETALRNNDFDAQADFPTNEKWNLDKIEFWTKLIFFFKIYPAVNGMGRPCYRKQTNFRIFILGLSLKNYLFNV